MLIRGRGSSVLKQAAQSILISGGRVIDPLARVDALMDVLLRDGQVAELAAPGKVRRKRRRDLGCAWPDRRPGSSTCMYTCASRDKATRKRLLRALQLQRRADLPPFAACRSSPVLDSPEWVTWVRQPQRGAVVNVFPIAAATQGSKGAVLTDFRALQRAGVVAVTDDGKPILSKTAMRDALRTSAEINFPIVSSTQRTRASRRTAP